MAEITFEHPEHGTITVDHADVKLPEGFQLLGADTTPEGYVARTDYDADIAKAATEAKNGLVNPGAMLDDDKFLGRLYRHRGITFDSDTLKPLGKLPDDYAEIQREVDTLRSDNKALKAADEARAKEVEASRKASRITQLRVEMDAPATYVRRDLLEGGIFPGEQPAFLKECAARFEYSDVHGCDVFRDEDGAVVMDGNRPAGVKKFLERLKTHAGGRVFGDRRQGGAGTPGEDGQHLTDQGKTMKRADYERLDPIARSKVYSDGITVVD